MPVMVLTPAAMVCLYPHVYKSLGYNAQQDFAPVTTINTTAMLFVIGPMVPATVKTLADFMVRLHDVFYFDLDLLEASDDAGEIVLRDQPIGEFPLFGIFIVYC